MNPFIANPRRLMRHVRNIGGLGADRRSRRQLRRDMVRANLRRMHDGWTDVVNRIFGTSPSSANVNLPEPAKLWYRPGTTDLLVLEQVLLDREYDADLLATLDDVRYIVDLGSNIGVTALFWAQRFPRAEMILVEPDEDNFALLERNTAGFRDRCLLQCAAVSDKDGPISFYRYNREYGHSLIRRQDYGIPVQRVEVLGVTIDSLIERAGFPRIDLLKMDIEGSEAILMPTITSWSTVPCAMVAELHDPYDFSTFEEHCGRVGLTALPATPHGVRPRRALPWAISTATE